MPVPMTAALSLSAMRAYPTYDQSGTKHRLRDHCFARVFVEGAVTPGRPNGRRD